MSLRLSTEPSPARIVGGYIPSLNGLRAVAIVIVILGHANLPSPLKGSTGVTLFFFLSGFLITTLLRVEADKAGKISIGAFYLRRVFRIFPPLYVALAVAVVLSLAGVVDNAMTGWGALSHATFWSNYYIVSAGRAGIPAGMNQLWSLAVEEHYYVVFPLLYIAMRKWLPRRAHQVALLVALCVGILLWRTWLVHSGADYDRVYLATDTRADAILWGAVLAIGWNPALGEVRVPRRSWLSTLVVVAGVLVFFAADRAPAYLNMSGGYTLQSLALFAVFVPLIAAPKAVFGTILNWKPINFLGILSYSIYLVHRMALNLAEQYAPGPHVVGALLAIVVSVGAAWLLHVYLEKPFAIWRKRLSRAGETENVSALASERA